MALIVIAADKGAPGVTTTALALAAVWPRPVLLAECDPSGGDLVYRFPAAQGGSLDPRRGLVTLAGAARRGLHPGQLWEHTQKMAGGLDVLTGVTNAEQGAGLGTLWGPLGGLFAAMSGGDVIADCGRLGADGPQYDLVAQGAGGHRRGERQGQARLHVRGRRHRGPADPAGHRGRGQPRARAGRHPSRARRRHRRRPQGRGTAARRVGRQARQDPAHPHGPRDRAAAGDLAARRPRRRGPAAGPVTAGPAARSPAAIGPPALTPAARSLVTAPVPACSAVPAAAVPARARPARAATPAGVGRPAAPARATAARHDGQALGLGPARRGKPRGGWWPVDP